MTPAPAIDPDRLRLDGDALDAMRTARPTRPPRHRPGQPFLKGPIPWGWLERAGGLPGKALHVALYLWREAGCRKLRVVRFRMGMTAGMGLSRWVARRGLLALQSAGLVSVVRRPGRCLDVTLNALDDDAPDAPESPMKTRKGETEP